MSTFSKLGFDLAGGELLPQNTRKLLQSYDFDASEYVGDQISSISVDNAQPEERLLALFDQLTVSLTKISQEIENDASSLRDSAVHTENILLAELESNSEKLNEVGDAVDSVKLSFDLASEGAVRIGGKLSAAERERSQIDKSIELLGFVKVFNSMDPAIFSSKKSMTSRQLKLCLPVALQSQDWGSISQTLADLKKILFELNSTDISNAQSNISKAADRVEMELLDEFHSALVELMDDQESDLLIERARELAEWLHLFNYGHAIQKRYIFTIVQHRIPNDSFFRTLGVPSTDSMGGHSDFRGGESYDSVDCTPDGPDVLPSMGAMTPTPGTSGGRLGRTSVAITASSSFYNKSGDFSGANLMDHLSGLFAMINQVCQEQFAIIRKVFPLNSVPRVTRMLIQRIFNDPAFGIQARVDSVLNPPPPHPPLPLADYLDALVTVREKLSALYLLLLDCCSHPAMCGMGSESSALKRIKYPSQFFVGSNGAGGGGGDGIDGTSEDRDRSKLHGYGGADVVGSNDANGDGSRYLIDPDEEADERMQSDAEIRSFFDDQISQVLAGYVGEYFDKEAAHTHFQYSAHLRKSVDDPNLLTKLPAGAAGSGSGHSSNAHNIVYQPLPALRPERVKSIQQLVSSVANNAFINHIFTITTDAIIRMESIGRDDKQLPSRVKDLFLLELSFFSDSLFIPWGKAFSSILLKQINTRASSSVLPPMELLAGLNAFTYGVQRIRSHFGEVYMRPLSAAPNTVAICKDNRQRAFRLLEGVAKEALHAWTICVVVHIEKVLATLQSRYDYAPKFEPIGSLGMGRGIAVTNRQATQQQQQQAARPTAACEVACKDISTVISAVRSYESADGLQGLDLARLFWRPLGLQLVGLLVSHLRKQTVSPEGVKPLLRDIKEYTRHLTTLDCAAVIDMMACLQELCLIYSVPADRVTKLVLEDLRHLDTAVMLGLLKARSDFNPRNPHGWAAQLSTIFTTHKWDTLVLPWEERKPISVAAFAEAVSSCGRMGASLGPASLRLSSTAGITGLGATAAGSRVTALFMSEVARTSVSTLAQLSANGQTVAVDLSRIEEGDDMEDLPLHALRPAQSNTGLRAAGGAGDTGAASAGGGSGSGGGASHFLPSRPDDATFLSQDRSASVSSAPVDGTGISRPDLITTGPRNSLDPLAARTAATAATAAAAQQQQQRKAGGGSGSSGGSNPSSNSSSRGGGGSGSGGRTGSSSVSDPGGSGNAFGGAVDGGRGGARTLGGKRVSFTANVDDRGASAADRTGGGGFGASFSFRPSTDDGKSHKASEKILQKMSSLFQGFR